MRLSYIGTRAASDTADNARYAEIRWKDGYMKDEELGYIFRCLLEDNGYTYKTHADGKTCSVTVEVKKFEKKCPALRTKKGAEKQATLRWRKYITAKIKRQPVHPGKCNLSF